MDEFITCYPGLYLKEEQDYLDAYREQLKANTARSRLSFEEIKATAEGMVMGVQLKIDVDPAEVQARMALVDPWNPLWTDLEYAKSCGYDRLPAPAVWPCPKGGYFGGLNRKMGDITAVKDHHHFCTFYRPIYQGDTLYPVLVDQTIMDITPYTGSKTRTWALRGSARVYNQDGELVMTQTCGAKECFKIYADPARRTWQAENIGAEAVEFSNHKIHTYTDADWDRIRSLQAQERRQGAQPLQWEDVQEGSFAIPAIDGPYTIAGKGGMIMSATAPGRSDIYLREHWGEPGLETVKDKYGIYHVPAIEEAEAAEKREAMERQMRLHPHPDEGRKEGGPDHKPPKKPPVDNSPSAVRGRGFFDNYTGRDSALRAIYNWMGDSAQLVSLSWGIGSHDTALEGIPRFPNKEAPLQYVPGMEDRHTDVHGEEGDFNLNKIYIRRKYTDDAGRHLVDLIWWGENIDSQIITEGTATVAL